MASRTYELTDVLKYLKERYPNESVDYLLECLKECNGNFRKIEGIYWQKKLRLLEIQYESILKTLEQEYSSSIPIKRTSLLKIIDNYNGDIDRVREHLRNEKGPSREELKAKYDLQLIELAAFGINIHSSNILSILEKYHGNIEKVIQVMEKRKEKKLNISEHNRKHSEEISGDQIDNVKLTDNHQTISHVIPTLNEHLNDNKIELHDKNHRQNSLTISNGYNDDIPDDVDNLRKLRLAKIHGNPSRILKIFYENNQSIESTKAFIERERQIRQQKSESRLKERLCNIEINNSYLTLNKRDDWPDNIDNVYLDGNNMMFVIDSIRRLCLNNQRRKAERAMAFIACAWNEQMHIENVNLVFDSTDQLDQIGCIKVSSAQPRYKTTDDMLIDIAQRAENRRNNRYTVVVTSDRELSIQLIHEKCQIVKSYQWFAHCVMVLAPDLIKHEQIRDATNKTRYNLDELVHRIAKTDS